MQNKVTSTKSNNGGAFEIWGAVGSAALTVAATVAALFAILVYMADQGSQTARDILFFLGIMLVFCFALIAYVIVSKVNQGNLKTFIEANSKENENLLMLQSGALADQTKQNVGLLIDTQKAALLNQKMQTETIKTLAAGQSLEQPNDIIDGQIFSGLLDIHGASYEEVDTDQEESAQ